MNDVAFPSISAGVYGYPIEKAATIAVKTVGEWAEPLHWKQFWPTRLKPYSRRSELFLE
ncbi:MAG: macro domain-containing protein [Salinivirgaceae bacterium]